MPPAPDDTPAPGDQQLVDLAREFARLTHAVRRLRGHGNQHVDGLSVPQFNLVEPLLDAEQPLSVGRLAELAGTTPPTATTMVRKLEDQGLVERSAHPGDRRVVRLALTEQGRAQVALRRDRVRAWRHHTVSQVAPEDRAVGARVLAAIGAEIERTADELAASAEPPAPSA